VSRSIQVNVFPCCTVGEGELVRGYAYDETVRGVKLLEVVVKQSSMGRHDIREAERAPEQGSGILGEGMKVGVTEAICNN
jgi:hypothetical protein